MTALVAVAAASLVSAAFGADIITINGVKADANSVLARLKDSAPGRLRALSVPGIEVRHRSRLVPGLLRLEKNPGGGLRALSREEKATALLKWIEELKASGQFEYVEPNYIGDFLLAPNDLRFQDGTLWGLHNYGQGGGVSGADISATNAWDFSTGATNVIVGIIDTGVRYTHFDLAAQMWVNPTEVPGDGIDDDNDGYVDNIYGIDPFNNDGDPMDDYGHGTHVAGIIGAAANDGNQHVGVAWRVRLMALKAGDANGPVYADAIRCLEFAADRGAKIVNMSFGGYGFSQALFDAINAARAKGVLVTAAAGNSGLDNDVLPLYPASYNLDNIISVASMNRRNLISTFSNYGRNSVHLAAPGEEIFSTFFNSDTDYTIFSGSSMAAPHVAGVATLVAAYLPGASYLEIRQRILDGVTPVPSFTSRLITGGRLNAFRALTGGIDGVIEYSVIPSPGSFLTIGLPASFSVTLSDGPPVTNATVSLNGGGTNLVMVPDGGRKGVYTNTYYVPDIPGAVTFTLLATAPGKTNVNVPITYQAVNRPDNDNFTNALKVPNLASWTHVTSNRLATIEGPAEQRLKHGGAGNAAASIWYSWSVRERTSVIVDTAGSTFDTVIGVYTGTTLDTLEEVVSANDIGSRKDAWVKFTAEPDVSYKIAIAGVPPSDEGTAQIRFELNGQPDTVAPIVQISGPVSGITTREKKISVQGTAFDPRPNASGIPEAGVQYLVSTNLTPNPNQLPQSAQGTTNWVAPVDLAEGINYFTVWAFDNAENRSIERKIQIIFRPPLVTNDLFFDRLRLPAPQGSRTDSNVNATREFREPAHAGNQGGKSLWYEFAAPESGVLLVSTLGSSFDTLLAVYTSTNAVPLVSNLQETAANDDVAGAGKHSEVAVTLDAGRTYYIVVDGFDGASGTVQLTYTFSPVAVHRLTTGTRGEGTITPRSGPFPENAAVSVVARPLAGSQFDFFETPFGMIRANPLTLVMTNDISVTAVFTTRVFDEDFESGFKLPFATENWFVNFDPANASNRVLMSFGNGLNRVTNTAAVTVRVVEGVGSFDFGVSTETNYDRLEFYTTYIIDGQPGPRTVLAQWSGENRGRFEFGLENGTVRLEWVYVKDVAITEGSDRVFIDNIDLPLFTGESALSLKGERVTLRVGGQAGQWMLIEASADLKTWTQLGSVQTDRNGLATFSEPSGEKRRFYRFTPRSTPP